MCVGGFLWKPRGKLGEPTLHRMKECGGNRVKGDGRGGDKPDGC